MQVEELCKRIEACEEYTYEESVVQKIQHVEIKHVEDMHKLAKTLLGVFWKLPKHRQQTEWIECVVKSISARDNKEEAKEITETIIDEIKSMWLEIGIRRIEKYAVLLDKLVEKMAAEHETPFDKYIKQGPNAKYDIIVMKRVIKARKELTEQETKYAVEYLIEHADTYYRAVFMKTVLPLLKRKGVQKEIAELAYAKGSAKNTSELMRKTLYAVHECYKDTQNTDAVQETKSNKKSKSKSNSKSNKKSNNKDKENTQK